MIVVPPDETKQEFWSGGRTRELFLFPPESSYEKRNFSFRLSSATIEASPSVFTPLRGYMRNTLILEGMLQLRHEGHYQRTLKKFDQDEYDGTWTTHSEGKSTNLNLMTSPDFKGSMTGITLEKGTRKRIQHASARFSFLYIHQGVLRMNSPDQLFQSGTLLGIERGRSFQIEAQANCELVIVHVFQEKTP